ncbi:hypothetical protein ACP70R_003624 [Stipagrostis hirtigluma subsp. patula]
MLAKKFMDKGRMVKECLLEPDAQESKLAIDCTEEAICTQFHWKESGLIFSFY